MSDKKIKCLIIDDEKLAQELIEQHLAKVPDFELIGSFYSALEAAPLLKTQNIDLLFLDIEMPDINGINFLKSVSDPPFTIFTTAYSEYALESYELNVIDYLLKPITFDRFHKAISKVREYIFNNRKNENDETEDSIFVKSDYKLVKINFSDILFVEGMQKYVKFHLKDNIIVTLLSLSKLETILPEKDFYRVHKSFIINMNKIEVIAGNKIIIHNKEVPISKSLKVSFISKLDKHGLL